MTIQQDFASGIQGIISQLGSSLTLETVGGNVRTVRGAVTSIGRNDGELINAVGIEGKIVYFTPITPAPAKFDRITTVTGREYTVQDVHDIIVDNGLVGYKAVVSG